VVYDDGDEDRLVLANHRIKWDQAAEKIRAKWDEENP
jgi:hypothetical protein